MTEIWPGTPASTQYVDSEEDFVLQALGDLYLTIDNVNKVLAARSVANGIAGLDANGYVPISQLLTGTSASSVVRGDTYYGHITDGSVHLSSTQNAFLDALAVSASEVNYCSGLRDNIQAQIDGIGEVGGTTSSILAELVPSAGMGILFDSTTSATTFSITPYSISLAALTDAGSWRGSLGLAIGSNVQAYSEILSNIVSSATGTNGYLRKTGTYSWDLDTSVITSNASATLADVHATGAITCDGALSASGVTVSNSRVLFSGATFVSGSYGIVNTSGIAATFNDKLYGVWAYANAYASGAANTVYGVSAVVDLHGSTTTDYCNSVVGFNASFDLDSTYVSSTNVSGYGVYVNPLTVSSATAKWANFRGVYIADQTAANFGGSVYGYQSAITAGTNRWGFYGSGGANNAFGGNTRIGSTTAPTCALDVTGALKVSSDISGGGYLWLGTSASMVVNTNRSSPYEFHVAGSSVDPVSGQYPNVMNLVRWSASDFGVTLNFIKSQSDTAGVNVACGAGNQLGSFQFLGADGAGSYRMGARVIAYSDSLFSASNAESSIKIQTVPAGSLIQTDCAKFNSDQSVTLYGDLDVAGALQCTGAATFASTLGVTGAINATGAASLLGGIGAGTTASTNRAINIAQTQYLESAQTYRSIVGLITVAADATMTADRTKYGMLQDVTNTCPATSTGGYSLTIENIYGRSYNQGACDTITGVHGLAVNSDGYSNVCNYMRGLYADAQNLATGVTTPDVRGGTFRGYCTGTTTDLYGIYSQAYDNGAVVDNLYGVYSQAVNLGASSVMTNGYAYKGLVQLNTTGSSLTTGYGIHLEMKRVAGTWGTAYGSYLTFSGTIGTKIGYFSTGETYNAFSGALSVGKTTAPSYAVDITGTCAASGGFSGNLVGNADTATKLATARAINGVNFDGSTTITVNPSLAATTANAEHSLLIAAATTGTTAPYTAAGLTHNPSTGNLSATSFTGKHAGIDASKTTNVANFSTYSSFTMAATGAKMGDFVLVSSSATLPAGCVMTGFVSSAGVVTVLLADAAGASVDPANMTYYVRVLAK